MKMRNYGLSLAERARKRGFINRIINIIIIEVF